MTKTADILNSVTSLGQTQNLNQTFKYDLSDAFDL